MVCGLIITRIFLFCEADIDFVVLIYCGARAAEKRQLRRYYRNEETSILLTRL